MDLLNQKAPGLEDKLRALSIDQRRRLVAAAEELSRSIKDLESSINNVLTEALNSNSLSPSQVAELRSYATAADDQYLTLEENGAESSVWGNWFAKARLATGLADVFGESTCEAAARAVYELCFVKDDQSAVVVLLSHLGKLVNPD